MPVEDSQSLLSAVRQVYQELDHELAPHQHLCLRRAVCCDFPRSDHVLFATDVEVHYLLDRHGPRPLPETDARLCPFWQDGLCTARETRPLGCRTYFCDPSWRDRGPELHERYHRRLVRLGEQFGVPYRYAPWVERLRSLAALERASLDPLGRAP